MKQTAVEWLFLMLNNPNRNQDFANKLLEKAKEMEKEQIIRTHLMARCYDNENSVTEAEEYYNETFKSDGLVQNSL
jgi:Tfp pilus assembly protein PilF